MFDSPRVWVRRSLQVTFVSFKHIWLLLIHWNEEWDTFNKLKKNPFQLAFISLESYLSWSLGIRHTYLFTLRPTAHDAPQAYTFTFYANISLSRLLWHDEYSFRRILRYRTNLRGNTCTLCVYFQEHEAAKYFTISHHCVDTFFPHQCLFFKSKYFF